MLVGPPDHVSGQIEAYEAIGVRIGLPGLSPTWDTREVLALGDSVGITRETLKLVLGRPGGSVGGPEGISTLGRACLGVSPGGTGERRGAVRGFAVARGAGREVETWGGHGLSRS
jgi:hypothetical protein